MPKPQRSTPIYGTENSETIDGTNGNDTIYGYGGIDFIFGYAGNDTLYGHEGNDELYGGGGDDKLYGQEGDDIVDGGAGNDTLGTGPGNDRLTGGDGADRFLFAQPFESAMNHHTIIDYDRSEGDYIDLRSIDADGDSSNNTRKGNTDFTVVETPTGAAGEAWMEHIFDPATGAQSGVAIYLNTDSDPEADMRIDVMDVTSLIWGVDILG